MASLKLSDELASLAVSGALPVVRRDASRLPTPAAKGNERARGCTRAPISAHGDHRVSVGRREWSDCVDVAITLISAFELAPESDEALLAGWERTRGVLAAPVLHRALGTDAKLRFVVVARADSAQAWQEATAELPFRAHTALYEAAHEDGAPDGGEGVVLINAFEVPAAHDERFLAGWRRVRDLLSTQRGYLGTRLHRGIEEADYRFVNIARWSSPLMFARALKLPEIQDAAAALPFASHPALYLVVSE
jgi:heme-degrading monooxygenase HmoA